ncbi:MAG: hypothetical protein ABW184_15385 [Sphingobium sp.]
MSMQQKPRHPEMIHKLLPSTLFLLAACGTPGTPPTQSSFEGLPVSGSLADARRAGFVDCVRFDANAMRCRRHNVTFEGTGPYEAAVDLTGRDGSGGFDQLTLWHDRDQYALYDVTDALERQGWRRCNTSVGDRGDQNISTHEGVPVRISMDLSYWGKRRLRVIPNWNTRDRRC